MSEKKRIITVRIKVGEDENEALEKAKEEFEGDLESVEFKVIQDAYVPNKPEQVEKPKPGPKPTSGVPLEEQDLLRREGEQVNVDGAFKTATADSLGDETRTRLVQFDYGEPTKLSIRTRRGFLSFMQANRSPGKRRTSFFTYVPPFATPTIMGQDPASILRFTLEMLDKLGVYDGGIITLGPGTTDEKVFKKRLSDVKEMGFDFRSVLADDHLTDDELDKLRGFEKMFTYNRNEDYTVSATVVINEDEYMLQKELSDLEASQIIMLQVPKDHPDYGRGEKLRQMMYNIRQHIAPTGAVPLDDHHMNNAGRIPELLYVIAPSKRQGFEDFMAFRPEFVRKHTLNMIGLFRKHIDIPMGPSTNQFGEINVGAGSSTSQQHAGQDFDVTLDGPAARRMAEFLIVHPLLEKNLMFDLFVDPRSPLNPVSLVSLLLAPCFIPFNNWDPTCKNNYMAWMSEHFLQNFPQRAPGVEWLHYEKKYYYKDIFRDNLIHFPSKISALFQDYFYGSERDVGVIETHDGDVAEYIDRTTSHKIPFGQKLKDGDETTYRLSLLKEICELMTGGFRVKGEPRVISWGANNPHGLAPVVARTLLTVVKALPARIPVITMWMRDVQDMVEKLAYHPLCIPEDRPHMLDGDELHERTLDSYHVRIDIMSFLSAWKTLVSTDASPKLGPNLQLTATDIHGFFHTGVGIFRACNRFSEAGFNISKLIDSVVGDRDQVRPVSREEIWNFAHSYAHDSTGFIQSMRDSITNPDFQTYKFNYQIYPGEDLMTRRFHLLLRWFQDHAHWFGVASQVMRVPPSIGKRYDQLVNTSIVDHFPNNLRTVDVYKIHRLLTQYVDDEIQGVKVTKFTRDYWHSSLLPTAGRDGKWVLKGMFNIDFVETNMPYPKLREPLALDITDDRFVNGVAVGRFTIPYQHDDIETRRGLTSEIDVGVRHWFVDFSPIIPWDMSIIVDWVRTHTAFRYDEVEQYVPPRYTQQT